MGLRLTPRLLIQELGSHKIAIHKNLTYKFTGIALSLNTPIEVGKTPTDPNDYNLRQSHHSTSALWDTGTTNSCITADVAAAIGAIPTGKTLVHGAHGPNY